jgi:hypothetical protein
MPDRLVRHRTAAAQPGYYEQGHARAAEGYPKFITKCFIIMVGVVGLDPGAWAVTINIDEFQHDTVLLPFVPQQGTLSLCENPSVLLSPITCEAPASDTVVFLAGATTGTALLESDLPEPGTPGAPGDRVLLIPFPAPFFSIGEPGAEEMTQTLLYTPALGQPGFALVEGVPVSYAITSDEVPEPTTWLLVAAGLVRVGRLGREAIRRAVARRGHRAIGRR